MSRCCGSTERPRAGGLKLTGEGGLLGKLTKMVVEGALEGEMDGHLGYARHDPAGHDGEQEIMLSIDAAGGAQ